MTFTRADWIFGFEWKDWFDNKTLMTILKNMFDICMSRSFGTKLLIYVKPKLNGLRHLLIFSNACHFLFFFLRYTFDKINGWFIIKFEHLIIYLYRIEIDLCYIWSILMWLIFILFNCWYRDDMDDNRLLIIDNMPWTQKRYWF